MQSDDTRWLPVVPALWLEPSPETGRVVIPDEGDPRLEDDGRGPRRCACNQRERCAGPCLYVWGGPPRPPYIGGVA